MPINNRLSLKWATVAIITLFGVSMHKEPILINKCFRNPIYCQIIKNNPTINKAYAFKLSNVIHYSAKLYDINPNLYTSILAQESMYKLRAVNTRSKDYGIAQINHNTIKAYGFSIDKLTSDVEYSVKAGARVLADFKRSYGHKEKSYWTRYNSSKPDKRIKYQQLVESFM